MLGALAVGGAGAAVGGILSYMAQMDANDRMRAMQDRALQEFLSINIPDPKAQEIALKRFVQEGTLTPEFETAIKQAPSEFKNIVTSQAQKSAQSRALSELENIGYSGGLRLQDKAALQDAQLEAQVRDRGNRQAILDDMNRRGQGGSGFALQAQLQGQQAVGDREANNSLKIAAQAQDRALQSIIGAGELATQHRSQDFQEQQARAAAQDAINRFNASATQDVQARNIASRNRAAEMNLGERQRVSDQNTQLTNQQQIHNKGLLQQNFQNQMELARGRAGAMTGLIPIEQARGQATANLWSNMGNAVSGGATAYGKHQADGEFWDKYFASQKKGGNGP
jgi:hypothetical protein